MNWMILALLQSCQYATELLTSTEEADQAASFVLGGACGMWVWEPPAMLAPSMDRSCPSHQQAQKCNLSTLSWHWIQSPHRLVCSEGLCIAAGRLGRSHTEQNIHVFMLKPAHPPPPSIPERTSACSSWATTAVHTTRGWLTACSPGVLWRVVYLPNTSKPNHQSFQWMDVILSPRMCVAPAASLFFHGLTHSRVPCVPRSLYRYRYRDREI